MSDLNRYNNWLACKSSSWEDLCVNCGACCGAQEDPCEHLKKGPEGKFFCDTYQNRFGIHNTISGKLARCVPIREKLSRGESWPGDERCGYKER
jgi:hypothetical protein